MNDPLVLELHLHEYLRDKVLNEFPDTDEETLGDTLEGLTDLHDKLAAVIRSQQEDRVLSSALKARIQEMQERLSRIDERIVKKRELAAMVMDRASISKISQPDFTASLRSTRQPLLITDEATIPEPYWKPQAPKLDRKMLLEDLTAHRVVPGACLGNGGTTIAVRIR